MKIKIVLFLLIGILITFCGNEFSIAQNEQTSSDTTHTVAAFDATEEEKEVTNVNQIESFWQLTELGGIFRWFIFLTLIIGLGKLKRLQYLNLYNNQLYGDIPSDLGNLRSLRYLSLEDNYLSGDIPSQLGNLRRLQYLSLDNNQLSGSIPSELGDMSDLQELHFYDNQLSGSIPPELGNLSNLQYLSLANNQLSGSIPSELSNLSSLQILALGDNQLSDPIPFVLGNLWNLRELFLYGNRLSGSIPSELGNLSGLLMLDLSDNQFSGSIPSSLGNLSYLQRFRLYSNQFIDLPDLSCITTLDELKIENNKFTFEDIEPNIGVATTFTYSPQDSVGTERDTMVNLGESLTLSILVGGEHNQYQWKKDGVTISGATDSIYTIDPITISDAAAYTCEIKNTIATELTLYSRPINVNIDVFSLNIEPKSQSISPGDSAVYSISVEPLGLFCETVHLSLSGLEQYGWIEMINIRPDSIEIWQTAQVLIKTGFNAAPGQYSFDIVGTSLFGTNKTTAQLNIEAPEYGPRPNLFTPNEDGFNDYVEFYFLEILEEKGIILIFDVHGRKIKEIRGNRFWYGRDDNNKRLKPGAYLYVVKVGKKVIAKGVIGLAL